MSWAGVRLNGAPVKTGAPPSALAAMRAVAEAKPAPKRPIGLCTWCGSIEVTLVKANGTRDLSAIGESAAYPIGSGCEVCA